MSIGKKLRRLREIYEAKNGGESKLSFIASEILGVENYILLNYESIKVNPPIEHLEKLAKLYDVSLEYIMYNEEKNPRVIIENKSIEELIITLGVKVLTQQEKEIFIAAGAKAIRDLSNN